VKAKVTPTRKISLRAARGFMFPLPIKIRVVCLLVLNKNVLYAQQPQAWVSENFFPWKDR